MDEKQVILNPNTNYYVSVSGKLGQQLLKDHPHLINSITTKFKPKTKAKRNVEILPKLDIVEQSLSYEMIQRNIIENNRFIKPISNCFIQYTNIQIYPDQIENVYDANWLPLSHNCQHNQCLNIKQEIPDIKCNDYDKENNNRVIILYVYSSKMAKEWIEQNVYCKKWPFPIAYSFARAKQCAKLEHTAHEIRLVLKYFTVPKDYEQYIKFIANALFDIYTPKQNIQIISSVLKPRLTNNEIFKRFLIEYYEIYGKIGDYFSKNGIELILTEMLTEVPECESLIASIIKETF